MFRKKHFLKLVLLLLLPGVLLWLTYRQVRQEKLNHALLRAVKSDANDTQAILSLLAQGADPNTHEEGQKPHPFWQVWLDRIRPDHADTITPSVLWIAVNPYRGSDGIYLRNNGAIIQALVEHGADVNAPGEYGVSILSRAVTFTNADTVKLLLDHGADVNRTNGGGASVLASAKLAVGGYKEQARITQILKEAGAKE